MKRLVIGAVMAVSALVSGTAAAEVLQCQRLDGTPHRVYSSGTKLQFGNTIFTFVKTGSLDNGAEVYVFQGNKNGKMLVMAKSNEGVVYQIRDGKMNIVEEGICQ